ncbi:oxidoreductase [Aquipluma nitroreducens]|uniref:Oxidoreductase n=1 Tax=Aquipluma nitroreducens TaxID=2010828 RepID=A0A5K7SCJ3_9BACT|nr:NAD(P)H-binding protein [Aquipluma nitroreducens]BBE19189.1 oxidoreductase [Aquipluma nitroreducens]
MRQTANVIGASGLVGHELLAQLLDHSEFEKVRIFVRRSTGIVHPKLEEQIIDFDQTESWIHLVKGDVLFSTLGTTIKTAKTKENQYRVDFTYQYEFAKAASENGVDAYLLVSSLGANPQSSVSYSRMKGELEDAVAKLPFKKLFIIRPSILDGNRQEKRAGEKVGLILSRFVTRFMLRAYKPTPVDLLASKMIRLSLENVPGIRTIGGLELFQN